MRLICLTSRAGFLRSAVVAVFAATAAVAGAFQLLATAQASEEHVVEISIRDHKFEPAELKLPTGKPIKISVKNLDTSAEEFESKDLGFEKVIAGNSDVTIRLKPLDAGVYIFYGEYHEDTAQGHIIAE
jgi:plastocyanin